MNSLLRRVCLTSVLLIQIAIFAHAQSVKLAWESAPEPDQMGYNVYRSDRPGVYTKPPLNGSTVLKIPSFTDSTVKYGKTYYYAVTTVSTTGEESTFSNEIEATTAAPGGALNSGAVIQPLPDHSSGLAIIGHERNGVLVSEAAIPASPLIRSGRIYVEFQESVNTGIAVSNPNSEPVVLDFYFADQNGMKLHSGSVTIHANTSMSAFINVPPFTPAADIDLRNARTFTFSSSAPIAFTAMRGFTNERSEFLVTPLPVAASASAAASQLVIPHYVDGGPWQSRIILVNPSNVPLSGVVELFTSQEGNPEGRLNYSIQSGSAITLQLAAQSDVRVGWIRITPIEGAVSPSVLALLSFRPNGRTEYEFGVTAVAQESAFRVYAEASGATPETGSVQSGFAVSNSTTAPALIQLEILAADGRETGQQRYLTIPPMSQISMFLDQIPELLAAHNPFRGFLRLSGARMSVAGLKKQYNQRGDLLITSTPAIPESLLTQEAGRRFPFFTNQPGYVTRLVVVGPSDTK